jgi:mannose-1-phosphate guanylyltransferase/phosphomannomutase
MFSIVKILEMLAILNVSIHDILRGIPKTYLLTSNIPCPWEKKGTVMRYLVEKTSDKKVELIDGIKVFEDNGWYLAIPSQDKAYFTVYAESLDKKSAEQLLEEIGDLVKKGVK